MRELGMEMAFRLRANLPLSCNTLCAQEWHQKFRMPGRNFFGQVEEVVSFCFSS